VVHGGMLPYVHDYLWGRKRRRAQKVTAAGWT